MKTDSTALLVCLDDFCKLYQSAVQKQALPSLKTRQREGYLSLSEQLWIVINYHQDLQGF